MASPKTLYSTMLIILSMSIVSTPCFGQFLGLLPNFGGIGPDSITKCLTSVNDVPNCIEEIITSFLSIQLHLLGPQCCKAALDIDDGCWPKIFPFNPFFPPAIKSFCSAEAQIPPPPLL
uniref:Prolamin-like domain-containing protein n=1 Tax=Nicotiana tabacum TaxID=4097 RepID=A0A1S3YHF9_TOBAC|nr:uncharacterized protein LOC104091470 [Nicotiana tomentosiformis]XP_016451382.1 PREDICTED: uncharacterized protein LOC107776079 [Nicotiana tabacum]